jgi:hypothetical protein
MHPAPDPSDILWENYATSKRTKFKRKVTLLLICFGVVALTTYFDIKAESMQSKSMSKYSRSLECSSIETRVDDLADFSKKAADDYQDYYNQAIVKKRKHHVTEYVHCFCDHLFSDKGFSEETSKM